MPAELIGEIATSSGASRERIRAEAKRAIRHLKKVCGRPPVEMELNDSVGRT